MKLLSLSLILLIFSLGLWAQKGPSVSTSDYITGIDWSMHPRFLSFSFTDNTDLVADYYSRKSHRYLDSYVNPGGYGITFKAITKNDNKLEGIISFSWEINGEGYHEIITTRKACLFAGSATVNDVNSECETIPLFPHTGSYKIKLTASSTNSKAISIYEKSIELKDYLIIGLGDSFASGEGNPDKKGDFNVLENVFTSAEALWLEPESNRSLKGAFALLAKRIEDSDPHSCVTFINVGTSGAQTSNGLLFQQHPDWQEKGQIEEVKSYIKKRKVDIILLSIGLNDLGGCGGMSELIIEAANPAPPEFSGGITLNTANDIVRNLEFRYKEVNDKLLHTLTPGNVFLFQIPVRLFRDEKDELTDGCGMLGFLENDDIEILEDVGAKFTNKQKEACLKFGWTYIDGITSLFRGHGYCADIQSWFVGIKESLDNQNNKNGSVHPNETGHEKIAELAFPIIQRIIQTVHVPTKPGTSQISVMPRNN